MEDRCELLPRMASRLCDADWFLGINQLAILEQTNFRTKGNDQPQRTNKSKERKVKTKEVYSLTSKIIMRFVHANSDSLHSDYSFLWS